MVLTKGCTIMIKALEESASKLGLEDELKASYGKLFSGFYGDYLGHGHKVEKTVIIDSIQELFPRYATLDRTQAIKSLTYFLDHDMRDSWKIDKDFLRLLRLLSNQELEKYIADSLKPNQLAYFVEALCKNSDVANSFQGTSLAPDAVAQKLLHSDLDEHSVKALKCLFKDGGTGFFKEYEDDIIAKLPHFLQNASHEYKVLIPMIAQRDCGRLQEHARRTLIEYTASSNDSFWQTHILEDLFKNSDFDDIEREFLYQTMNSIYQEKKCITGLQLLWMHLKDIPEHKEFLQSSVLQYFGVDADAQLTPTDSFSMFFNEVLIDSYNKAISREQFLETLKIAHETKLATLIEPKFLALQKDWVIFDEQTPFQQRATLLDQRLLNIQSGSEIAEFYQTLETSIADEDLRIYARDILITLKKDSTSFDIFKAKKSLQQMHKKYKLKGSVPEIVWNISRDLPNFSYHKYRKAEETPTNRISLAHEFGGPHISHNGLIYGYDTRSMNCSLWAIDEKTLDAVWQVPVKNYEHVQGREPKFVVHNEVIYLVDGKAIRSFNRKTGIELDSYPLQNQLRVTTLKVDAAGLLYVVHSDDPCHEASVAIIDPRTGTNTLLEGAIDRGGKDYFTAGETFGFYYVPDKTITLYTKDLSKKVIAVCANKEEGRFFNPHVATKDSQIIFAKCLGKDDYQLVSYDTITHSEAWSLPLSEGIRAEPCISKDGQKIFIINKDNNKIIAIENNNHTAQQLWSFEVPKGEGYSFSEVNELAISPDGKTLFALNVHGGGMYTINAEDGKLISTSKCEEGRSRYLAGVSQDGLPYIHPVYY